MKKPGLWIVVLALSAPWSAAEERPLTARITSLGLFKNGLAVVQRTAEVDGPGLYCLADVPEPVHGTYWVESDAEVSTRVTRRLVDAPLAKAAGGNFQEELAGREVEIHFSEPGMLVVKGTVLEIQPPRGAEAFSRRYEEPRYGYWYGYSGRRDSPSPAGRFLVLRTADGLSYVDSGKIAFLRAKGTAGTVRQRKAVLLLTVGPTKGKPATITISYLAKGMAWAPSYRVDLTDPKTLVLKQNAVIKNELESFEGAKIQLISGFPGICFKHVTSPLSLNTTWAGFFQQLNQRFAPGSAIEHNVVTQQAVTFNRIDSGQGIDLSAMPAGEGVDLHFQDLGFYALDEGDSLAIETASGKADYERIVEWIIPDTRQANGQYINEYQRQNDPEKYEDAVWDAVRFRNPLKFPMTTAPAMVVDGGKFNGQQMSYWVNAGEETTLHVTKSLSVRTRSMEHEIPDTRRAANYYGDPNYWKVTLEGEVRANNHRRETITLLIRRQFSGELDSADGNPQTTLLEGGAGYVNQRNQLTWSLTLKPGEEAKRSYRYTLLVRR
jgi:hypothetical protein